MFFKVFFATIILVLTPRKDKCEFTSHVKSFHDLYLTTKIFALAKDFREHFAAENLAK
jgi:hypothetical protein